MLQELNHVESSLFVVHQNTGDPDPDLAMNHHSQQALQKHAYSIMKSRLFKYI